MSLDEKPRGNPNWKKGTVTNPGGKPRGTKNKKNLVQKVNDRLQYKHKMHPVDQLVSLAVEARMNNDRELAAEIWMKLLSYMEPTKKPVEVLPEKPTTPEQSKEAAEAALRMLEEFEHGHRQDARPAQGTGNPPSVGDGATSL